MCRLRWAVVLLLIGFAGCGGDDTSPTGPTTGSITATVSTSGEDIPSAYTVVVNGGQSETLDANGSVTFSALPPGSLTVELTEVPENCTVTTANPITVNVAAGNSTPVVMTVVCVAKVTSPDFDRDLGPGEYQVSVTGDVERSFEATGAMLHDYQNSPGSPRTTLFMWDDLDALDGAEFDLCPAPFQPALYVFDAMTQSTDCPQDPTRVTGGFIIQLGAPQEDELDCYPNSYGDKDFEGVLTITTVTDDEIHGEAQGAGTCTRHPYSEVEPMQSAVVSVRIRFRAVRGIP